MPGSTLAADTTAADALIEILEEFETRDIRLVFAELKGPVKDRLRAYGLYDRIGDDYIFPTIGSATSAYVHETGVDWVDWTER